MNNKLEKPWYKRWKLWAKGFVALIIIGLLLPDPPQEKPETTKEASEENINISNTKLKSDSVNEVEQKGVSKVVSEETKTTSETKLPKAHILTKDEVLKNFEVEPSVEPFIDGTFTFVGDRTDTADYYSLADTDKFRNASIIFKDGQIARLKLIPTDAKNVKKLFEEFGITGDPRKLNGATGFYEVALIPKYWTQNIEKYPYDKD